MVFKEYSYEINKHVYKIDNEHSCINVYKNNIVIDIIPNNFNKQISQDQFMKLVFDHSIKYSK